MLYATSKGRFRQELDRVHYELQVTDLTELETLKFWENELINLSDLIDSWTVMQALP